MDMGAPTPICRRILFTRVYVPLCLCVSSTAGIWQVGLMMWMESSELGSAEALGRLGTSYETTRRRFLCDFGDVMHINLFFLLCCANRAAAFLSLDSWAVTFCSSSDSSSGSGSHSGSSSGSGSHSGSSSGSNGDCLELFPGAPISQTSGEEVSRTIQSISFLRTGIWHSSLETSFFCSEPFKLGLSSSSSITIT